MTIRQCTVLYRDVEIELLLAHVLRQSREFIFLNPEYALPAAAARMLLSMVRRRRKGEPLAYIVGYKDFMGLRFAVSPRVLVPRPETEGLVDIACRSWERLRRRHQAVRIADVGTGSGCIAVCLAKRLHGRGRGAVKTQIFAADISAAALRVAKRNAAAHGVKIFFQKSDLLKHAAQAADIIVANLPYGWQAWKNNSSAATVGLRYEPRVALFTEEHGLYVIRRLLEQVAARKKKPAAVALEYDPRQKNRLERLIKKILPTAAVGMEKDFRGLWRYAVINL